MHFFYLKARIETIIVLRKFLWSKLDILIKKIPRFLLQFQRYLTNCSTCLTFYYVADHPSTFYSNTNCVLLSTFNPPFQPDSENELLAGRRPRFIQSQHFATASAKYTEEFKPVRIQRGPIYGERSNPIYQRREREQNGCNNR